MKFKPGDRVAVYSSFHDVPVREVGVVVDVLSGPLRLRVDCEGLRVDLGHRTSSYHHKQCRLLKKKERRRVWVDLRRGDGAWRVVAGAPNDGFTEFIEVKKKVDSKE